MNRLTICRRRFAHSLRSEHGQMVPEFILTLPVFLLALVIVVNVGMFIAESARFDRVVNEVARSLVTSETDPSVRAGTLLNEALGYNGGTYGPYQVQVSVARQSEPFFERRILTFRLIYRLFAAGAAPVNGGEGNGLFSRSKTLVIPWSRGL